MILQPGGSSVVPTLRYRDLDRAVPWLCAAFGFTARAVVQDAGGKIVSAQLVSGNGMVMLAPVGQSGFDELMKQPDEIGGAETQSCYFVISDSDAHYAAAMAQGAEIVLDLQSFEHGGRGYLCRDLEGHLWSFGTFDPWKGTSQTGAMDGLFSQLAGLTADPRRQLAAAVMSAVGLLAGGAALAVSWHGAAPELPIAASVMPQRPSAIALFKERGARLAAQRELANLRTEKDATETDSDKLREQLEHLTVAKEAAERATKRLVARAMGERQQRTANRRRAEELAQSVEKERQGKQRSERAFQNLKVQLEKELLAKDALERGKAETDLALAKEREARKRAELSLQQTAERLKQDQEARKAAEVLAQQTAERLKQEQEARKAAEVLAQQTPPAAKAEKQLSPPRPAKRPDTKATPPQGGAATGGDAMPDFQP